MHNPKPPSEMIDHGGGLAVAALRQSGGAQATGEALSTNQFHLESSVFPLDFTDSLSKPLCTHTLFGVSHLFWSRSTACLFVLHPFWSGTL